MIDIFWGSQSLFNIFCILKKRYIITEKIVINMVEWSKEFKIGKYSFTLIEIRDLVISMLVLGLIFSAALPNFSVENASPIVNFFIAVLIVGPALLFHELAHKIVAQKYGLRAAYVLWPMGVLFSILLTLLTQGRVLFAALGAVMISSAYTTRVGNRYTGLSIEEMGKISIAGPFTNIVIALIAYAFVWLNPDIVGAIVTINLIVALFNLLPFPPLDGLKIFGWNKVMWLGLAAAAAILLYLPPFIGLGFSLVIAIILTIALFIYMEMQAGAKYVSTLKMP
jgi:Zn-dependent protease